MTKILTGIWCLLVLLVGVQNAIERPGRFYSEKAANEFLTRHLLNLTESLVKDALYKLRMAHTIQMTHRISKGYELGIIASSLMDKYRHMIRIYRYYSNAKSFRNSDHSIEQIMNGYSVMQGDYNEIVAQTVMYYDILDYHLQKDSIDHDEAVRLSKKYRVPVESIRNLQKRGVDLGDLGLFRRYMQDTTFETKLPDIGAPIEIEDKNLRRILMGGRTEHNINVWTPKKKNNSQEEEYKKNLRYTMWAEKWKGYNGETEGVHIDDSLAKLGYANDSDFLLKDLKGVV